MGGSLTEIAAWVFHALKKSPHFYFKKYLFFLLFINVSIGFCFHKTLSYNSIPFSVFTWPQILYHAIYFKIVIIFLHASSFHIFISPSLFDSHIYTLYYLFFPLFLIILKAFYYYFQLRACLSLWICRYACTKAFVCVCMHVCRIYAYMSLHMLVKARSKFQGSPLAILQLTLWDRDS